MREEGHVYYGEAFVVASDERNLPKKIEDAIEAMQQLDWRVYDLVITPVPRLEESQILAESKRKE